jgi:hypothetical protein
MLFLLNTVVVKTQLALELPPGLERLARATPSSVLDAGCELYARHPRLEYDQPDIARWYCTLLQHKIPGASAAHFALNGGRYTARLAEAPLPHLVRLWNLQDSGRDIGHEVWRTIWSAARQPAA